MTSTADNVNTLEPATLNTELQTQVNQSSVTLKTPKRVLHFCDGTLEEYSSDEESNETDGLHSKNKEVVDPSTLSWSNWMYHHMASKGSSALAVCDYLGENVAYYLGITSPKYQYEIEEAERALKEEEEERKKVAEEMIGWSNLSQEKDLVTSSLPTILHASEDLKDIKNYNNNSSAEAKKEERNAYEAAPDARF